MQRWLISSDNPLGKQLLINIAFGILCTILAIVGMIELSDFVNIVFFMAGINAVVIPVCVVLHVTNHQKACRVVGAIGAVILVFSFGAVFPSSSNSSGPPYSGTVASEDPLNDQSQSYTLTVDRGNRIKIDFSGDSRGFWYITLPETEHTIRGQIPAEKDYSAVRNVEHTQGIFEYTVNQSGTHKISVSAEVYESANYRISVQESNG